MGRFEASTLWRHLAFATLLCASPRWAAAQVAADAAPAGEYPTVSWGVVEATTTVSLHRETFAALGVEVIATGTPRRSHQLHQLSVISRATPSYRANVGKHGGGSLLAVVGADGFHGFAGGPLRHEGGVQLRLLRVPGKLLDLSDLEIRPGESPRTLELLDARGVALLVTADPMAFLDAGSHRLSYLNADVRVLPALADFLGDARYAGMTIGVFDFDAVLSGGRIPPPVLAAAAAEGGTPPPCGDWSGTVDVALVEMANVSQAPGGIGVVNGRSVVVVVPSAKLENAGTANVPWYTKFTNLANPPFFDQHPYLVWQVLRSKDGVLEPLGRSDLKHAFATENVGCDVGACSSDPHILGLGCADTYPASSNTFLPGLGPRSEVNASTGIWPHCGGIPSHFDVNGDCVQDFVGAGETQFTHGAKVAETDLQVAGATYFMESFYIVRDDVNIFNSMGYRRFLPSKPASTWVFANDPSFSYTVGPALNAWVDPTTPAPGADNHVLDTGTGQVQLAMRVTDVTGFPGLRRFAYALQNHDFDRRIGSFHVPFDATTGGVVNVAYADGDGFTANDWTWTLDSTGITWTAPAPAPPAPAPELDYASLVSFHFETSLAPVAADSTLGVVEAGSPMEFHVATLAPQSSSSPPMGFYTMSPCRVLDTRTGGEDAIASGVPRDLHIVGSACAVPAGADAVVVNVTAVGATSGGEIALYSESPSSAAATVRFSAGVTRANNAIVRLTSEGRLNVRPLLDSPGATHVVIDVAGYFVTAP